MARSFAKVFQRIWADPDWRALDCDAQHLYFLLISQPQMNLAGLMPIQLRKWASCVSDWDAGTVEAALKRLSGDRFVVVDEETEEVFIRTLIRNDEAYRTPGMLKSILKFAEGAQSAQIRRALCAELGRLPRLEGKTAEASHALIAATRVALGWVPEGIPDGIGEGMPDTIPDGIPDGMQLDTIPDGLQLEPIPDGIADTSVSVSGSVSDLSSVLEGVGKPPPLTFLDLDEPPPCARHAGMDRDDIPPCRRCGQVREEWQAAHDEAAKPKPPPPLCGQCDNRWIETARGAKHCPRCHPAEVRR